MHSPATKVVQVAPDFRRRREWPAIGRGVTAFVITCVCGLESETHPSARCRVNHNVAQFAPEELKLREGQQRDEICPIEWMLASQSGHHRDTENRIFERVRT